MNKPLKEMTYEERILAAIEAPADYQLPPVAPVVAMFAQDFRPVLPPAAGGDNMTSYEIVQTLEDTAGMTTQEVALVMTFLGYRLHVNDYKGHEWAMRPAAEKE